MILLGDFNFVLNKTLDSTGTPYFPRGLVNRIKQIYRMRLVDGWRMLYPEGRDFTLLLWGAWYI